MHTCPMVTPGVPPIPHVGGPILPPCAPTVLIDFLPAARVTDMAMCVGPPDVIVKGSAGVLISMMPAARIGDTTAHGGVIVMGSPTCIIGEVGSPSPGAGGMGGVVAGLVMGGVVTSFTANASVYSSPGQAASLSQVASPGQAALPGAAVEEEADATVAQDGEGNAAGAKGGTPCRGNTLYHQEEPMSCVLASSRMIIKQLTGKDPGEAALRSEAQAAGWFDPVNGSDPWQIPTLLKSHGVIGAIAKNGMSLNDLKAATALGKPVMAGLKNPGHRILVDGVQTNADGSQTVLVRDPGYPGSRGCCAIPATDFLKRYNSNAPVISFK